jgi:hypothetical protein
MSRFGALLLLSACAAPFHPPEGDDDESTPTGDDDSASAADAATFAAAWDGAGEAGGSTQLDGEFQFLYWQEGGSSPDCRVRFALTAEVTFAPMSTTVCPACAGLVALREAVSLPPESSDGDCGARPDLDLSFLLGSESDFATLGLLSVDWLEGSGLPLGRGGLGVDALASTYDAAGFRLTHVGLVQPDGWLAAEADLDDVAAAWGAFGWLPFFAVYRAPNGPGEAARLEGSVRFASLWSVGLD